MDIFPFSERASSRCQMVAVQPWVPYQLRSSRQNKDGSCAIEPLCLQDKTKYPYCHHVLFTGRPEMVASGWCILTSLLLQCYSSSHNNSPLPQQSRRSLHLLLSSLCPSINSPHTKIRLSIPLPGFVGHQMFPAPLQPLPCKIPGKAGKGSDWPEGQ